MMGLYWGLLTIGGVPHMYLEREPFTLIMKARRRRNNGNQGRHAVDGHRVGRSDWNGGISCSLSAVTAVEQGGQN